MAGGFFCRWETEAPLMRSSHIGAMMAAWALPVPGRAATRSSEEMAQR